jgi:thiopeptide-type bacteriocin biosynthesis protein
VSPKGASLLEAAGFIVVRTPLLPFDAFTTWSDGLSARSMTERASLARAVADDIRLLLGRLADVYRDPLVREALRIASPDLADALDNWLAGHASDGARVSKALARYFVRMTCRPTPFGLFSGCSLGEIAEVTHLELDSRDRYRRIARVDCGQLFDAVRQAVGERSARHRMVFRSNDSIAFRGGRLTLVESRFTGKNLSWHLVAIDDAPEIRAVLRLAETGARFDELVRSLVGDEVVESEAEEFVHELVDSQVLLSDLQFGVTGEDPLVQVLNAAQVSGATTLTTALQAVQKQVGNLNDAGLGLERDAYDQVTNELKTVCTNVNEAQVVQVDMFKAIRRLELGSDLVEEVANAVGILARLPHRRRDHLSEFRKRFRERYDKQDIPITEAIDGEYGVGLPDSEGPSDRPSPAERDWDAFLVERYIDVRRRNLEELEIKLDQVDRFLVDKLDDRFPTSLAALISVGNSEGGPVGEAGSSALLKGVTGPSGATFLGRFCHGDEHLLQRVRDHIRTEEERDPEAIFAEIAHVPGGRVGNILFRPRVRQYEIPYLCKSGVEPEFQLAVSDLLVRVAGERIELWSMRLGRRIVPRLTNAHNHAAPWNLPLYRFLCALQDQDALLGVGWSWGALGTCSYLPRVRYGRVVLSRALWRISTERISKEAKASADERFSLVQRLRDEFGMPRHVALIEGDNELTIDLDNVVLTDLLFDSARDKHGLVLSELWPSPGRMATRGPEGSFTNEVVVPLARSAVLPSSGGPKSRAPTRSTLTRSFPPGSEWVYARLYTGEGLVERLLLDVVRPLVADILRSIPIANWHFVRYHDADHHVRLRFSCPSADARALCRERVDLCLLEASRDGLIHKAEYGTYEREVERYGEAGIELAERAFTIDSAAVLDLVHAYPGDQGHSMREQLLVPGIEWLLAALGLDGPAREQVLGRAVAPLDPRTKKSWASHFRQHRNLIRRLLAPTGVDEGSAELDAVWRPGLSILRQRSTSLAGLQGRVEQMRGGTSWAGLGDFFLGLTHMHANRLVRNKERVEAEPRTYDAIRLHYRSLAAIAKASTP